MTTKQAHVGSLRLTSATRGFLGCRVFGFKSFRGIAFRTVRVRCRTIGVNHDYRALPNRGA